MSDLSARLRCLASLLQQLNAKEACAAVNDAIAALTRPQDASGDAERALEWLGGEMRTSTVYMNGSRAFSPSSFAMRKHDLRGRTFLEAVLNAMQAKEAK